jgi:cyanophycin synthetase
MKIREINAMRGPNYWSVRRHKLIVMVLDLEEMEELPSNKVDGFAESFQRCILIDVQKLVKVVFLCA